MNRVVLISICNFVSIAGPQVKREAAAGRGWRRKMSPAM